MVDIDHGKLNSSCSRGARPESAEHWHLGVPGIRLELSWGPLGDIWGFPLSILSHLCGLSACFRVLLGRLAPSEAV